MLKGFKDFLLRGNVVDLAVAVVIGAAFTSVVTSFTNAFLQPLIRLFSGGGEFAGTIQVNGVEFDWASFVNAAITFIITAAVVYFMVVYPMKWLQERRRRGEEVGPSEPTDVALLGEIRDLLRDQADRVERLEALNGRAGPTARMPPQPSRGYEPYPDSPYAEPSRAEQSRAEPAYAQSAQSAQSAPAEPAYGDAPRRQPRPTADGEEPRRHRRHSDQA